MPLDSDTAAKVARRHGLTLGDAAALQRLADTPEEADELAAQFTPASHSGGMGRLRDAYAQPATTAAVDAPENSR